MRIYVSGPISGTDDYMERFDKAEKFLTKRGYEVVNPARVNAQLPKTTTWHEYMGESLKMLCGCESIYMLHDWENSKGAVIEYIVAKRMGMMFLMEGVL